MMINWNMQNNSNLLFKVFTMTKFIFTQLYDLLISTNSVKLYLLRMLKEQCVVILHLSIQKSLVEYYPNHFQRCLNPEKQLNSITPLFIWSLVNGIMSRLPSVSALRKHVSLTYMPKIVNSWKMYCPLLSFDALCWAVYFECRESVYVNH